MFCLGDVQVTSQKVLQIHSKAEKLQKWVIQVSYENFDVLAELYRIKLDVKNTQTFFHKQYCSLLTKLPNIIIRVNSNTINA